LSKADDAGRYEFSRIPEGHYVLSAQRRGYVQTNFLRDVNLRRGETARVDVALERAGTISGRVVDEFGEPITDVRVEALLAAPHSPRLSSISRQRETDDEGRFRLFELPPGRYFVRAEPPDKFAASRDALAYAPAFAPGVPDVASAQAVVIGRTRDVTGIDIRLTRQRTSA
jgi:hypothetical protein